MLTLNRSKFASRPRDIELRSATSHHAHDEDRLKQDFSEALNESYSFNDPLPLAGMDGDIVAEGGQWASGEPSARDMLASSMGMTSMVRGHSFHGRTTADSKFELSPTDSVLHSSAMPTPPTFRITDLGQHLHSQDLDMPKWHRLAMNSQLTPAGSLATGSSNGYKCPQCFKLVKRACDLRYGRDTMQSRPFQD